MKALSPLLLLALLSAGCAWSARPEIPTRYHIIQPSVDVPRAAEATDLVLAVEPLDSPGRYTTRIFYRSGGHAVGYHEFDRWAEPPAEMLTSALRSALQAAGVARVVADGRLVRNPAVTLQGCLTRCDEVHGPDAWSAECAVELLLTWKLAGGEPVAIHLAATRPAKAKTAAAVVEAMNDAAADIALKAAQAVAKALAEHKAPPAGGQ